MRKHGIADGARGIVEIDVDAGRAGLSQRLGEVGALVVDRRVIAERVEALPDLGGTAGNPDGDVTVVRLKLLSATTSGWPLPMNTL